RRPAVPRHGRGGEGLLRLDRDLPDHARGRAQAGGLPAAPLGRAVPDQGPDRGQAAGVRPHLRRLRAAVHGAVAESAPRGRAAAPGRGLLVLRARRGRPQRAGDVPALPPGAGALADAAHARAVVRARGARGVRHLTTAATSSLSGTLASATRSAGSVPPSPRTLRATM